MIRTLKAISHIFHLLFIDLKPIWIQSPLLVYMSCDIPGYQYKSWFIVLAITFIIDWNPKMPIVRPVIKIYW
jgi:hypothetical protein